MDQRTGFEYEFDPEKHDRRKKRTNQGHERLPRAKRRKTTNRRKTVASARKNRPYQNVSRMNLECCTEKTCLLNQGHEIINIIRKNFDSKLYDQQNIYLSSLINVDLKLQRKNISYNIKDVSGLRKVKVCKTAFLKIFGIGKKRITVLLKKIQPYSGYVQEDLRRNNRNQKKLPLVLKAEVMDHIRSYEREVSHYAREKTKDRQYLNSNLNIAILWRQFREKKRKLEGVTVTLSYSSFRSIFRSFKLSFRKPRVDTCGFCDGYFILNKYSKDDVEKEEAKLSKSKHLETADQHYNCINYDLTVLPVEKNNQRESGWTLPPLWRD